MYDHRMPRIRKLSSRRRSLPMTEMTNATLTTTLHYLLQSVSEMDAEDRRYAGLDDAALLADASAETFEAAGLMTRDDGLVVRLADGTEYQITVQRSH